MVDIITTSLQASFGVQKKSTSLTLEFDLGSVTSPVFSRLRLYPNVDAIFRTDLGGEVRPTPTGSNRIEVISNELVVFNNSDTASTSKPIDSLVSITKIVGGLGTLFDIKGNEKNPTIGFNPVSGLIESSEKVIGTVVVTYQSGYRLLDYIPQVTQLSGGGTSTILDTVIAIFEEEFTTLSIVPGSFEQSRDYEEIFTITSEIIITSDGAFEKPPNWPADGNYPISVVPLDPTAAFLQQKRVHAYVYADFARKLINEREVLTFREEPYLRADDIDPTKASSYFPVFSFNESTGFPEDKDLQRFRDRLGDKEKEIKERYGIA